MNINRPINQLKETDRGGIQASMAGQRSLGSQDSPGASNFGRLNSIHLRFDHRLEEFDLNRI